MSGREANVGFSGKQDLGNQGCYLGDSRITAQWQRQRGPILVTIFGTTVCEAGVLTRQHAMCTTQEVSEAQVQGQQVLTPLSCSALDLALGRWTGA